MDQPLTCLMARSCAIACDPPSRAAREIRAFDAALPGRTHHFLAFDCDAIAASASPEDKRITYGCINVPVDFYEDTVRPLFRKGGGIVYVLPDTKPLEEVFPRVQLLPYL
jgi:hypothetical protein